MAKEIYLYNPIYSFVAEELMQQMNENMNEEITMRLNTPGGSVFSGYGILSKMSEHGNVTIKIDGFAASMGAFMLLYANKVECNDVSKIMLHRADMYTETQEQKTFLASVNKDLRAKLEKKIKADVFAEVTGVTFDEMFNPDKRIDVWLDAKQAKKIGLVDKINKLDPKELEAFSTEMFNIAAKLNSKEVVNPEKPINMNIEKLKAEHPDVYAQIFALGQKAENDRVQAWLTYVDADAKTVTEGIKGNEAPSLAIQAELNRKAFSIEALKNLENQNPVIVQTPGASTTEKTAEELKAESIKNDLYKQLNLSK
jgi:ATP-dependent protease ClpP protease subunit